MYYKLDGHKVVECEDIMEWAKWFDTNKPVAQEEKNGIKVSTVFNGLRLIGLDHNLGHGIKPLLFETMILGGREDGYQDRYSTWEEAEEGHKKACILAWENEK